MMGWWLRFIVEFNAPQQRSVSGTWRAPLPLADMRLAKQLTAIVGPSVFSVPFAAIAQTRFLLHDLD